jgi:heterodisulfide reductase subunit A-like polyferredoxin
MKLLILFLLVSCGTHRNYAPHHHHLGKANCSKNCRGVKVVTEEGLDRHNPNGEEYQLYHDHRFYYFSNKEYYKTFKAQAKLNGN